jgi:hypothetical protein
MAKRKLLPGEGDYGTRFDEAVRVEIGGGRAPRVVSVLSGYENELIEVAENYHKDLETGYLGIRQTVSLYQMMTQLRGFWPMSSVDHNGNVYDLSAQGRTLGRSGVSFGMDGVGGYVPVASFGGAGDTLSLADSDAVNLNGLGNGFTILAWARPGWAAGGSGWRPLVSKGSAAGTMEYGLVVAEGSMLPRFFIGDQSHEGAFPLAHDAWHFMAASYHADGHEVLLQVNAEREVAAIEAPALVATTDDFFVGRWTDGSGALGYWQGEMTLLALCAGVVPQLVLENVYRATAYLFGG